MHNGGLLADGNVLSLKKKFDAGFHLIVKHKRNTIYDQSILSSKNQLQTCSNDDLNEDNVYKQLVHHVKSFVHDAKDLNDEDEDDGYGGSDPFNYVQDESLLSRFHLPYVSENSAEEESNLYNIQRLLASLDEDWKEETNAIGGYSRLSKGRFDIDSYILDCTSLEQIFMSLLHVSTISDNTLYGLSLQLCNVEY